MTKKANSPPKIHENALFGERRTKCLRQNRKMYFEEVYQSLQLIKRENVNKYLSLSEQQK
jgi:hypothetical protein